MCCVWVVNGLLVGTSSDSRGASRERLRGGYGAHICGAHRGVWRVKISLREKCTAATFRPTGRLPGLVGSCSASHSVQIARGRLLQKRSCIPTAVTGGVGGFGWESNSHAPRAKTLRTYCVPVRAALRPRVPRSAPLGCSCLAPAAARRAPQVSSICVGHPASISATLSWVEDREERGASIRAGRPAEAERLAPAAPAAHTSAPAAGTWQAERQRAEGSS